MVNKSTANSKAYIYRFGAYELDTGRLELRYNDDLQKIEPQVYLLLELLIKNRDRIVDKAEIINHVWGGRIVSDNSIDNRISASRQAVGDNGRDQNVIKTFQGLGFRFILDVEMPTTEDCEAGDSDFKTDRKVSAFSYWVLGALFVTLIFCLLVFSLRTTNGVGSTAPLLTQSELTGNRYKASIAILPFEDMTQGGDEQYLGDGIAEELLNVLSNLPDIKVPSRTSSFALWERKASMIEIGEALDVLYVVEGSVRRSGQTLRITAQLIEVQTDEHLWSQAYDKEYSADNMLAIQDDIALQIKNEISQQLNLSIIKYAPRIKSTEAYQYYLRSQKFAAERTEESLNLAKTALIKVIELEPSYVPAYTALIDVVSAQTYYSALPKKAALIEMRQALNQAKSYDVENADILAAAGLIKKFEGQDMQALELYVKALEFNPNHVKGQARLASVLWNLGKYEDADKAYEKAVLLNPVSQETVANSALIKLAIGDLSGAYKVAKENILWHPKSEAALVTLARIKFYQGDYAVGHQNLLESANSSKASYLVQLYLAKLYANIGLEIEAIAVTNRLDTKTYVQGMIGSCDDVMTVAMGNPQDNDIAFANYMCGDTTVIFPWLRHVVSSYGYGDPNSAIGADQLVKIAIFIDVLNRNEDPDGQLMLDKLGKYYGDKGPKEFDITEQIIGGAAMHMLKGDQSAAMEWLDELIERGHPFTKLTRYQFFTPLEDNPDFELRRKGFENNAQRIREIVEQQRKASP